MDVTTDLPDTRRILTMSVYTCACREHEGGNDVTPGRMRTVDGGQSKPRDDVIAV